MVEDGAASKDGVVPPCRVAADAVLRPVEITTVTAGEFNLPTNMGRKSTRYSDMSVKSFVKSFLGSDLDRSADDKGGVNTVPCMVASQMEGTWGGKMDGSHSK